MVDSGLETGDRIVVEGIQFVAQEAAVVPTESEVKLKKRSISTVIPAQAGT